MLFTQSVALSQAAFSLWLKIMDKGLRTEKEGSASKSHAPPRYDVFGSRKSGREEEEGILKPHFEK